MFDLHRVAKLPIHFVEARALRGPGVRSRHYGFLRKGAFSLDRLDRRQRTRPARLTTPRYTFIPCQEGVLTRASFEFLMELTAARGGLAFSPRNNASFARSVHFARRPLIHACSPQSSFRYEDTQDVRNSGIRFEYNSFSG